MLNYVYDGSFEGILTAVYEAYRRRENPAQILPARNLAVNLLDSYEEIATDLEKCEKVASAIRNKISEDAFQMVTQVCLSNCPDKGTRIYDYLRLGFRYGPSVDNHLHEDSVLTVHEISRQVSREVHRFEGLLRFVKTKWEIYYARFEPDHDITMLLAPHFAERLSDQNWIIHDTKRDVAAMFNQKEWILAEHLPDALAAAVLSDCEGDIQDIWKEYFRSIAIAERTNPKLQRNMMPARYWKNLTEMGQNL